MLTHSLKIPFLKSTRVERSLDLGLVKPTLPSIKQVNIPVHIGEEPGYILTDVVDCEIPLLLSKDSMKKADSKFDFVNDVFVMSGQRIQLQHTLLYSSHIQADSYRKFKFKAQSYYSNQSFFISRKCRPEKFQGKACHCYQATSAIWTSSLEQELRDLCL